MNATLKPRDGAHDFDFLFGSWGVMNRRLRRRFAASNDWDVFPAHLIARRILGGAGNFDEIVFTTQGWSGSTLRLFDATEKEWSLYWANSRDGVLFPPVIGRFEGARGVFYGEDVDEGKRIRVRYIWSGITSTSARWEQAFSRNGAGTWETNWIMELARTAL